MKDSSDDGYDAALFFPDPVENKNSEPAEPGSPQRKKRHSRLRSFLGLDKPGSLFGRKGKQSSKSMEELDKANSPRGSGDGGRKLRHSAGTVEHLPPTNRPRFMTHAELRLKRDSLASVGSLGSISVNANAEGTAIVRLSLL